MTPEQSCPCFRCVDDQAFLDMRRDYAMRGDDDRADTLTIGVAPDGSVEERPLTINDLFAWLNRVCRGDVS